MKRLEIIRELRRHRKLAEKRAIDYERNKTAKYVLMFPLRLVCLNAVKKLYSHL